MRASSAGSLSTASRVGTATRRSPFASACAANSRGERARTAGRAGTRARSGASAPASRRERSMSWPNCASSASSAAGRGATSGVRAGLDACAPRARRRTGRRACSGWRKSWLAAASSCDFARFAASAARPRLDRRARLRPQLLDEVERSRSAIASDCVSTSLTRWPKASTKPSTTRHHERGVEVHRVAFPAPRGRSAAPAPAARSRRTTGGTRR